MTSYMVPTEDEYVNALSKAKELRDLGEDPYQINKTLIYQAYKMQLLEHVYETAAGYLHAGQGIHEHQLLMKAIDNFRRANFEPGQPFVADI